MNIKTIKLPDSELIRVTRKFGKGDRKVEVVSQCVNPGQANFVKFMEHRNVVDKAGNLLGFTDMEVAAVVPIIVNGAKTYPAVESFDSLNHTRH